MSSVHIIYTYSCNGEAVHLDLLSGIVNMIRSELRLLSGNGALRSSTGTQRAFRE